MSKYRLDKSTDHPHGWVLTDTENLIVIRFEEHKFNETQKVSVLDESDRLLLIRHKYPRFTVEILDDCKTEELANALKKAGEFLRKRT